MALVLPGEIGQVDQSCVRGLEAAGIEVERSEIVVEVHVQPFAASFLGVDGGSSNQLRTDTGMLVDGTDLGIEQKGMVAAIPCNVDEANQQSVVVPDTDPAKAVRADPVPPPVRRASPVRLREGEQLLVVNIATPLVVEIHFSMVADDESFAQQPPRRWTCPIITSTPPRTG
jgi:hypothetical protein